MLEDLLILFSRTEVGVRIGFVPSALVLVTMLSLGVLGSRFPSLQFSPATLQFFIMLSLKTSTVSPRAPPSDLLGV